MAFSIVNAYSLGNIQIDAYRKHQNVRVAFWRAGLQCGKKGHMTSGAFQRYIADSIAIINV